MEKETAIIYCRVSDPRQVKRTRRTEVAGEKDSLDRQQSKAEEYAARKGFKVTRVWLEQGESAKTGERTELWNMHSWCKSHPGAVTVLVIPMIDRFARNMDDYVDLRRMFRELGIRIASVEENIDDSPEGRLQENIMASFAQFDNERRAARSRDGMVEAARSGRWVWQAPFGYKNVKLPDTDPNIAPYEPEASMVRRAFSMLDMSAITPNEVYSSLVLRGLQLSRQQFYRLIRNPAYIGIVRAFGTESKATPPFVAIVDEDVFWRVQHRLSDVTVPSRKSYVIENPDFPLRGTIRCECGKNMTASWTKGKYSRFAYYLCTHCPNSSHGRTGVEDKFVDLLDANRLSPATVKELKDLVCLNWQVSMSEYQTVRKNTEKKRDELFSLQKSFAMKSAMGVIPDDLAKEHIMELRMKSASLLETDPSMDILMPDIDEMFEFAFPILTSPGQFWKRSDLKIKKGLQRILMPNGVLYTRNEYFGTPGLRLLVPKNDTPVSKINTWCNESHETQTPREIFSDICKLRKLIEATGSEPPQPP